MSSPTRILLLGATQGVGKALLPSLISLLSDGFLEVHAISRHPKPMQFEGVAGLHWHIQDLLESPLAHNCSLVISLGPISFAHQAAIVAPPSTLKAMWVLSTASTNFKADSTDLDEQALMRKIACFEKELQAICDANSIAYQVLKTTLLYGRDNNNVNRLAGLMERMPLVPVFGSGRRAPVHVDDVAELIYRGVLGWIHLQTLKVGTWQLQGGDVLSYQDMLHRIASSRGMPCWSIKCPQWIGVLALKAAHSMGQMRDIHLEMLRRQGQDLIVDDSPARLELAWHPRPFMP